MPPWAGELSKTLHDIPGEEDSLTVLLVLGELLVDRLKDADVGRVQCAIFRKAENGDELVSEDFNVYSGE